MSSPARQDARTSLGPARGGWRAPLAVLLIAFAIFGLTARHGGGSWDYYTANYASWHLVHAGNPWLEPGTVPVLEGNPEAGVWVREAPNGHTVVSRFPGTIAITLPAYWIAQSDTMTVVPGAITAALACALGLMLMFLALRRRIGDRRAAVVCAVLGFGTPVWTIAADATWPHTLTMLGICGLAWATASGRWFLAGVFGGVTLWGRLHAALIVAVVGVLLGWWRRSPRITLVIGAVSSVFLALLCVWTRWMYGVWSPTGSYNDGVFNVGPQGIERITNQLGMWVSPDRGILVWTPILVLLAPAVVRAWPELPDWTRSLFVGGLVYTLVQTLMITFTGGDSFYGYRLGIEFVVAATPAVAMSLDHVGPTARKWLTPVLTLQFVAIAFGSVFDVFLAMDRAWTDNVFFYSMRRTWPFGPAALAAIFCFVFLVTRRLAARNESTTQDTPDNVPAATH